MWGRYKWGKVAWGKSEKIAFNNGISLSLNAIVSIDSRKFRVVYSAPVGETEALVPGNYSISGPGGVVVVGISKETSISYLVETTEQTRGGSYTVTVLNIRDLDGKLIS